MSDLESLFTPSRVAAVGATGGQSSVGRAVMENLENFDGEVVPVNPNQDTVFGRECYPDIEAVPAAITELDINPLVAGPNGVSAIDLRITVDRDE